MDTSSRTQLFETAPIKSTVLKQIIPAIASQMIMLVYNLADTYFVGLLGDASQTAGITICYAPFLLLGAFSNLFGIGGASALSRALGKHNNEKASHVASISFWIAIFTTLLYSLLFYIFRHPLLSLCGATSDTYSICEKYALWVIIIAGVFTVLNQTLANLIRSEGNSFVAAVGIGAGGVLNILLDPLFILPQALGFGATGAGIATAISNFISMIFLIAYVLYKTHSRTPSTIISLSISKLNKTKKYIGEILSVGLSSALQSVLTVVAVSAQLKFVSKYTTEALAGLGIVKKLDQVPIYFALGVSSGIMPFLAYNYASGNDKRRREGFWFAMKISVGFALLIVLIYEIFAPQLTSIFIDDAVSVDYATSFLRRLVIAMPLMAFCYPMIIQFQAMQQIKASLICSIIRKGALDIPFLFLFDKLLPLYGCMWVQPVVDTITLITCMYFYMKYCRYTTKNNV